MEQRLDVVLLRIIGAQHLEQLQEGLLDGRDDTCATIRAVEVRHTRGRAREIQHKGLACWRAEKRRQQGEHQRR